MYQRDYIMRMLEMLGELIAGILGLIRKGQLHDASVHIDRLYYDMLKKDAAFFSAIPKNELTQVLLQEHNYSHGHLEILAELFFVQGKLSEAENSPIASLEFYEKSLLMIQSIIELSRTFSLEHRNRETELKERVESLRGQLGKK
ncbi:DUF6483 family protein [Alkaliflexus imshenetskii]|uniref:DUF6483 family protein n=1 Tax=Alkaliflexus imshenetskii TaxID=286730 RepID=UPI000479C8D3|nr:DUF6483 family protein [Alkaliflexus imshenetskii]